FPAAANTDRAESTPTFRGLSVKMTPTYDARSSRAYAASAALVIPQNFIRVIPRSSRTIDSLHSCKASHSERWIARRRQKRSDEHGVGTDIRDGTNARHVRVTTFRDSDTFRRNVRNQCLGCALLDLERFQISIIYANDRAARGQCEIQLPPIANLSKDFQS